MRPSTEARNDRQRLIDLRKEVSQCDDPYGLLAEFALENERLRNQITRYEQVGSIA